MNRLELCRIVAEKEKVQIRLVLNLLDAMIDDVIRVWSESGSVTWPRCCTWYVRQRKARLVTHNGIKRKRAAAPGEPANEFSSLVPAAKVLVFDPSIYFKKSVSGRGVLPVKQYDGAGAQWCDRMAARVGMAGVEVKPVLDRILLEIIRAVTMGMGIQIDGFGEFYSKRRGGRYYSVNAKGGGRKRVYASSSSLPAYRRDNRGAGG